MHENNQSTNPNGEQLLAEVREHYDALRGEISKVIVGQDEVVDQILLAIFSRGHAMLVGVPGLAKTLLISTIARAMSLEFSRIQFTPDLMPSDITGTEVIEEDKATGHRSLRFVRGPVFANVVLADEINIRAWSGVCECGPRGRDQPNATQDAGGAARSDAGTPGHHRRHTPRAARTVLCARDTEPARARRHLPAS